MDKTGIIQAKNSTFIWEINHFNSICSEIGEYIESPFFTAGEVSSDIIKWRIVLYPFGQNEKNKNYLSIYLVCIFCGNINECHVSFKFYLWNGILDTANILHTDKFTTTDTRWGFPQCIRKTSESFQNHLHSSGNDTLRIACSISNIETFFANTLHHQTELIESFDHLFLSESFSDLTIEVDNKKLKVHKNILAARSEVFSAMFRHNTVESTESVIRITDISYDVMKEVLRFIYCGKVEIRATHKEDLLAAANKYNIILLKKICEQYFWNNVNINNACEFLSISDLYNCDELKFKIIGFVVAHLKEIVDIPDLKKLSDSNPELLITILRMAAEKITV